MLPELINTLLYIELIVSVAVVITIALQACIKQGFIAFLVVAIVGAAVVIMMFFSGVTDRFFADASALVLAL